MTRILRVCIAAITLAVATTSAVAQGSTPEPVSVRIEAVSVDGGVRIDVVAEGVTDLGAFGFTIAFEDPLEVDRIEQGELLAASGREVFCPDPVIEDRSAEFRCVTLGDSPAEGSSGSGRLASVLVKEPEDGSSRAAALASIELAHPQGGGLEFQVTKGTLVLFGDQNGGSSFLWAGVAAVAAAVLGGVMLLLRRRHRRAAQIDGGV